MNVNGPCFLSLQQFQIIEVAFPMYAYYTKAPLWIRGKGKKSWWNGIEGSKCFSALCQEWRVASRRCCSGAGKEFSVWTLEKKNKTWEKCLKVSGEIFLVVFPFLEEADSEAFKTTACWSKVGFWATDLLTEFKSNKKKNLNWNKNLLSTPSVFERVRNMELHLFFCQQTQRSAGGCCTSLNHSEYWDGFR